jgi:hypothetical protein
MIYLVKRKTRGACTQSGDCYRCLGLKNKVPLYICDDNKKYVFITSNIDGYTWCDGILKEQLIPINTKKRMARFLIYRV